MLGLYLEALENSSDEELFTQVYERCKRGWYITRRTRSCRTAI